jgi:hypothetical protein
MNIVSQDFRDKIHGKKFNNVIYNSSNPMSEEHIIYYIRYKHFTMMNIFEHITNKSCTIIAAYILYHPWCKYTLDDLFLMNDTFKEYVTTINIVDYRYLWNKLDILTTEQIIGICIRDPTYIENLKSRIIQDMYNNICYSNPCSIEFIPKEYHNNYILDIIRQYSCYIKYIRADLITSDIKKNFIEYGRIHYLPLDILTKDDFVNELNIINYYDICYIINVVNHMPIEYYDLNIVSHIISLLPPQAIRNVQTDKAYKIYSLRPDIIKYNYKVLNIIKLWRLYPHLMKNIVTLSTYNPNDILLHLDMMKKHFEYCSIAELIQWCYVFYGKPFTKHRNNKRILLTNLLFDIITKNGTLIHVLYDNVVYDVKCIILKYYIETNINMGKVHRMKCLFYHYDKN